MKILFICKGNVGRSQMAEALMKRIHPEIEVVSAGTSLSGPEQSLEELLPKTKEVLDVMTEEEIDISKNIRKQLTEKMVHDADKIITIIEDTEELPEYLSTSSKLLRWNVADPKGKDLEFTRNIKEQIKQRIISEFK